MPNIDGLVRLRDWVRKQSHALDVKNAYQGIGMVIHLGIVVTVAPDLSVRVVGAINYTDEDFLLSVAQGLLVVPENLRLTVGDVVAILPMAGGNRWLVGWKMDKTSVDEANRARLGYNGDNTTPNNFVGIQVTVPDGDAPGTGSVLVQGQTISITSFGNSSVVIDGINFKGHRHSDVQGGTTGTAQ